MLVDDVELLLVDEVELVLVGVVGGVAPRLDVAGLQVRR